MPGEVDGLQGKHQQRQHYPVYSESACLSTHLRRNILHVLVGSRLVIYLRIIHPIVAVE